MKSEFDLEQMGEVPDPLSGIADLPLPPLRSVPSVPSPTRSAVVGARAFALVAALLYECGWLSIMRKRSVVGTVSPLVIAVEVAAPTAAAFVALVAATAPGARGLGTSKARLAMLALLSPALFVAATSVVSAASVAHVDPEAFWPHCLRCFAWTSLYSAGPMLFALWVFRRSFVVGPAWRMGTLAVACAATGAATMSLVCSEDGVAHVLVGHGGMMVVAGLMGAAFGRQFGAA